MQVASLWAIGVVATVCSFAAYTVLGNVLAVAGLPSQIALSPAAFAVFALAALFNPLYAALLPLLLPVSLEPVWNLFTGHALLISPCDHKGGLFVSWIRHV